MDKGSKTTVAAAQRHIIERPRLTKLLDDSNARVILLVAPAGYGKTTLARQWMATKPQGYAWYACGGESADAAGLAMGIARAANDLRPGFTGGIRNFLRGHSTASDVRALIQSVVEALQEWPTDHWLVIDDYHFAADSDEFEGVIHSVTESTEVPILIATRLRPGWVSARSIMYGTVVELGPAQLAMSAKEARETLGSRDTSVVSSVMTLADGWPAVVGLAALTSGPLEAGRVPAELHDFLAQELFGSLTPEAQGGLTTLSLSPQISQPLASAVLGSSADAVIDEGLSNGFLSAQDEGLAMHPLLREFLQSKADEQSPSEAPRQIAHYLIESRQWDDAFAVIAANKLTDLLSALLRESTRGLLRTGRGATLSAWLEHARRARLTDPFVNVAASELSFQEGDYKTAARLADTAIRRFSAGDPILWRAWFDLAESTYFGEDVDLALTYFERAGDAAQKPEDKREALWGALCCANYGARPQANRLVTEFEALRDETPEFHVRLATARATNASNFGGIDKALDEARTAAPLLAMTSDVMIRSAFRHGWIAALTLNARYEEAGAIIRDAQTDAEASRLLFTLAMIDCQRAAVEAGLGRYTRAAALTKRVEEAASQREDRYLLLVALTLRARLAAVSPSPGESDVPEISANSTGAYSEYLSAVALLRTAQGDTRTALSLVEEIESTTSSIEAQVHSAFIRAIIAHQRGQPSAGAQARTAYQLASEAGVFDPFVYAYRVCNPLLESVLTEGAPIEVVAGVLRRAGDRDLARRFKLGQPSGDVKGTKLTPREEAVLRLVARGLTNPEIAKILFVSPVTVKVHLRHVYEKLGVRSRTEAALRAQVDDLI